MPASVRYDAGWVLSCQIDQGGPDDRGYRECSCGEFPSTTDTRRWLSRDGLVHSPFSCSPVEGYRAGAHWWRWPRVWFGTETPAWMDCPVAFAPEKRCDVPSRAMREVAVCPLP